MVLDIVRWVVGGLVALIIFWVVVRVGAAAFFKSKQDFERNTNGTQQKP